MPVYDYQCKRCSERFEYIQKFSEPPMKKCEACGGKLEKLLTAPAFHLKGGGWYADGYADARASGSEGAEAPKKEGAAGEASAKGEGSAKTAAKGETKGEKSGKKKAGAASKASGSGGGGAPPRKAS